MSITIGSPCQLYFWDNLLIIDLFLISIFQIYGPFISLFHLFKSATTYYSTDLVQKWFIMIHSVLNLKKAFIIAYSRVNCIYIWQFWVLILAALPWASFLGISILWWWLWLFKILKYMKTKKCARHNTRCSTWHLI